MKTIFVYEHITGGGLAGAELPASLAAEGAAMRRALAEDFAALGGVRVAMTLDGRLPDEPGRWRVFRVGPGEESAWFDRLAAEADYTLAIAPETDGTLLDLARAIERAGGRSLGASPSAIELAGDKLRLGEELTRRGIATPRSIPLSAGLLPRWWSSYPAVVKPVEGAGSIDTYYIEGPSAVPRGAEILLRPMLLQPFVAGVPMSAGFLVDAGGRAHRVGVGRQRIEVRDGRITYRGGVVPAHFGEGNSLEEIRRAVDAVPGLLGWVGVDFLWDEAASRATLLEVNPRPTTSLVGFRQLLGPGRLARAWLDAVESADGRGMDDLSARVRDARPLAFDASGTVYPEGVLR